ncbi:MAG: BON domain-containing protein [Nanoarchaeota archaeon]
MIRTDEDIKKDIIDSLYWDSRIDVSNINVEVNEKKVILTGNVPTYLAKNAATDNAILVEGVISVVNNLIVTIPSSLEIPDDNEIKRRVNDLLLFNPDIDSTDIIVSSEDGIVTLSGNVDAFWKKTRAEELAYNIFGVWDVINELTIVPSNDIDDKIIADDIMASLKRKSTVDEEFIDVEVDNGNVTLTGEVLDWIAYKDAENAAKFTLGVIDVINDIVIRI